MTKHKTERQKELRRRRQREYYQRKRRRMKMLGRIVESAEEALENQPEFHDTRNAWEILEGKPKKMKRKVGRPRKQEEGEQR